MSRPSPRDWTQLCEAASKSIVQLRHTGPFLEREAADFERGFRESVRLLASGGAGGSDHSDPVADVVMRMFDDDGNFVAERDFTGEIHAWSDDAINALQDLIALVSRAEANLMPAAREHAELRQNTVTPCVHCSEPAVPRPRAGRCFRCYQWRLRHEGQDRPLGADVDDELEAA